VATVTVSPSSSSIAAGQTVQLGTTLRDAGGNTLVGRVVTWASSNTATATVNASGLVTGAAAGSATITATSEGKSGTASITVTVVPVASVSVAPATLNLTVGQTGQLTSTQRDANGNPLTGRSVTWTTNNAAVATVNSTGLVTARGTGSATITATSEGKSGSAGITVTGSGPGTPIDTVFIEDFESGNLSQWEDGVDASKHRVVSDPTFAQSGNRYLEVTYVAGGDGGWITRWFMPGYDSLFVSYYIRFEPAWVSSTKMIALYGSRTDDQWSSMGQAGICPNGTDFFAAMLVTEAGTGDPGSTRFYSYYPAMAREPDGVTCWGRYGNGSETYMPPLEMSRGVWHRVELWVKLNTPGQSNAQEMFWIDGVQRGSWPGLSFRNSNILRLNAVQLPFNRVYSSTVQRLFVDHLVVTTGRPTP
jgi:hypothetical protein